MARLPWARLARWGIVLLQVMVLGLLLPAHHHKHVHREVDASPIAQTAAAGDHATASLAKATNPAHHSDSDSDADSDNQSHCQVCHLIHALGHVGLVVVIQVQPAQLIEIQSPAAVALPDSIHLSLRLARGPPTA